MKYLTLILATAAFSMPTFASEMESHHLDNIEIFKHQANNTVINHGNNELSIPAEAKNLKR